MIENFSNNENRENAKRRRTTMKHLERRRRKIFVIILRFAYKIAHFSFCVTRSTSIFNIICIFYLTNSTHFHRTHSIVSKRMMKTIFEFILRRLGIFYRSHCLRVCRLLHLIFAMFMFQSKMHSRVTKSTTANTNFFFSYNINFRPLNTFSTIIGFCSIAYAVQF